MVLDWSIESGWFIISVITASLGIILSILKLILEPILKTRYEKKIIQSQAIEIKYIDLDGIISYKEENQSLNKARFASIKLNFSIRNLGNQSTTVRIYDVEFRGKFSSSPQIYLAQVLSSDNTIMDLAKKSLKIDVPAQEKVTTQLKFQLNADASFFDLADIKFHYKYENNNGEYVNEATDYLVINLQFPS